MQLNDKVVVVTGAARGIGQAIAVAFAGRGARLALIDRSATDLNATAERCAKLGASTASYECDVASESMVIETFDRIASSAGRLDVLVNNAGITRDALLVKVDNGKVVRTMSLDQWRAVIDVNLTGVFLCGREAASHMIELGNGGVIVNISSISKCGNAGQTNYSAAKAGVAAMTVVWAKELARYKIRAGSIAPGMTRTEMVASMKTEALDKMMRSVPLGRTAEVEEIASAAVFIAENDFFSGRTIELDGGMRL
jgi:3-oxoacyl-[acyl-carrier protein] reductase